MGDYTNLDDPAGRRPARRPARRPPGLPRSACPSPSCSSAAPRRRSTRLSAACGDRRPRRPCPGCRAIGTSAAIGVPAAAGGGSVGARRSRPVAAARSRSPTGLTCRPDDASRSTASSAPLLRLGGGAPMITRRTKIQLRRLRRRSRCSASPSSAPATPSSTGSSWTRATRSPRTSPTPAASSPAPRSPTAASPSAGSASWSSPRRASTS